MPFEDAKKEHTITPIETEATKREHGIRQFLAENLPATEERIREPMNSQCEVCVVLPAYSERQYILRPLTSLAGQEGVGPDQYEVIVVVNNPPNMPEKSEAETENEYRNRVELYNEAVKDNQETLKLIGYINGGNTPVTLTEQEKEAVATIQGSGLRLFAIDKASEGKTLSNDEANVGGARNRGIAEAIERFYEHVRKNGILVHSDAEVRFSNKYIQDIIRIFKQDPELVGVTNTVDHEPAEDTNEIFRTVSLYTQMQEEYEKLSNFLHKSNADRFIKSVDFDGSNMASRAFETAIVGGIPKIPGAEDTYFGWHLAEIGKVKEGHEPITTTIDRFSSRTTTGRGLKTIRYQDMIKEKGTVYVGDPEHANTEHRLKEEFFQAIQSRNITPDHLKQIFQINGQSIFSDEELNLLSYSLEQIPQASPTKTLSILLESKDQKISNFFNRINVRSRINSIVPNVPIEIGASKLIEILSADGELQKRYISIRQKLVEEENQEISNGNKILDSLCNIVFAMNDQRVLNQPLAEVIRQHKTELGISDQQLQSLNARNSVVSALSEILSSSSTKQEALEKARETFRYMLSPVGQNDSYLRLIELRAMRKAVEEKDHPKMN